MITTCINHQGLSASWTCNDCYTNYCDSCVKKKDMTYATFELCPACGGACHPRAFGGLATEDFDFLKVAPKSLAYPATPNTFIFLFVTVVLLFFVSLLTSSFFWVFGIAAWLAIFGYYGAHAMSIARHTGLGEDEPPDWPDPSDMRFDLISVTVRFLGAMLVPFAPAILLFFGIAFGYVSRDLAPLVFVFEIIGALLAPMSLLAVSMGQTLAAASPHIVIPAIMSCLKDYALAIVFMIVVVVIHEVLSLTVVAAFGIIGTLLADAILFYSMMVQARIMGLLYRAHHEDFPWVV